MALWFIHFGLISAGMLWIWRRNGPRHAIVAGTLLVALVPEWVRWYPFEPGGVLSDPLLFNSNSLWITVRVACGAFGGCLYVLHPRATYNLRLIWSDWAVLGLAAVHLLSDSLLDGFQLVTVLRAYGEWVLPYLLGRIAIQSMFDVRWALAIAVTAALVLAVASAAESLFSLDPNPSEILAGLERRPEEGTPHRVERLGVKRAYGPSMHPIYFAALQFLLLPWTLYAASRAIKSQSSPIWWSAMPLISAIGIAGTVSRAPFLAIGGFVYVLILILKSQWRPALAIAGVVLALTAVAGWSRIITGLEDVVGENRRDAVAIVDGKEVKWTGTRHRLLLFQEYWPAIRSTGLLGWGTRRMTGFPPDIPRSSRPASENSISDPVEAEAGVTPSRTAVAQIPAFAVPVARESDVDTLDNAFLLMTLRFGWLGLVFFTAVLVLGIWNYVHLAVTGSAEGRIWLAASAAAMAGMALILLTVWMPQDFGFFYLWSIGASAGLLAERENPQLGDALPPT